MREFHVDTQAILDAREGIIARQLVWITAKNRSTGLPETIGFWNGEDHQDITVGGDVRTYYGAGLSMTVPRIVTEVGLQVRRHKVIFSAVAPEVQVAIREYDAHRAPIEIHRVLLDLGSRNLVSDPFRVVKGRISKAPIPTKPPGEESLITLEIETAARALARPLALLKSDESQQLRGGDRIRRYGDVSGDVTTYWGERRV